MDQYPGDDQMRKCNLNPMKEKRKGREITRTLFLFLLFLSLKSRSMSTSGFSFIPQSELNSITILLNYQQPPHTWNGLIIILLIKTIRAADSLVYDSQKLIMWNCHSRGFSEPLDRFTATAVLPLDSFFTVLVALKRTLAAKHLAFGEFTYIVYLISISSFLNHISGTDKNNKWMDGCV